MTYCDRVTYLPATTEDRVPESEQRTLSDVDARMRRREEAARRARAGRDGRTKC